MLKHGMFFIKQFKAYAFVYKFGKYKQNSNER